jgi:hypothetical protein
MEPNTPPTPQEKKGLGRLWRKFKTAFKKKEIPPAPSPSTPAPAAPMSQPAQAPIPDTPRENPPKPCVKSLPFTPNLTDSPYSLEPQVPQPLAINPITSSDVPVQSDVDRRLERARALFRKYDFDIDESEWKIESSNRQPTERVHKSIRMRVRYTCHSCRTVFGHDKVCLSCHHSRCSHCTRYPPKKVKKPTVDTTTAAVEPVDSTPDNKVACHECQTGFEVGTEKCPNCNHNICDRCIKQAIVAVNPPPAAAAPAKKVATAESNPLGAVPTITT